jgi:hypothetical protein
VDYACFDVRVDIGFMGIGTPDEIDVDVAIREIQSDNEARIFFGENEELNELTQTATLTPVDMVNFRIYLLNNIKDKISPLELVVEVLPNTVTTPSSPGDGSPEINDLTLDFFIRQPTAVSGQVYLRNDCGEDAVCQTDFAISSDNVVVSYISDNGLSYDTIVAGEVQSIDVDLTLSNTGSEDAIDLILTAENLAQP